MTTTAQKIVAKNLSWTATIELAERASVDVDQDWTAGRTMFDFRDGSRLVFCGTDIEIE